MKIFFKIADIFVIIVYCFWYILLGFKLIEKFYYSGLFGWALLVSIIIFGVWYVTFVIRGIQRIIEEISSEKTYMNQILPHTIFTRNPTLAKFAPRKIC